MGAAAVVGTRAGHLLAVGGFALVGVVAGLPCLVLITVVAAAARRGVFGRRASTRRSSLAEYGCTSVRVVLIREFVETDWSQVWPIVQEVVQAQETFPYDPSMTAAEAHDIWIEEPPGITVVAVDADRVLGTAKMGPNHAGPGAHVSTASFMVAADARGHGVGAALCRYALDWARQRGYAGMQFNAVAESIGQRSSCTSGSVST